MGHRMIHVCDGCGVEHEERDLPMHADAKMDTWGRLHIGMGLLPVGFDLCDACVAKIVQLLGLRIPDEEEIAQRMNEYAGPGPLGGMFNMLGMGVPHIRHGGAVRRRRRPGMRVVSGGLPARPHNAICACHDGYKCIPETCTGHCDKCLGRDGA